MAKKHADLIANIVASRNCYVKNGIVFDKRTTECIGTIAEIIQKGKTKKVRKRCE